MSGIPKRSGVERTLPDASKPHPNEYRMRSVRALQMVCARGRKKGTGSRPRAVPGISGNERVGRVPVPFSALNPCVKRPLIAPEGNIVVDFLHVIAIVEHA